MNTYGLFSVNVGTFNRREGSDLTYPQEMRNVLVTFLKIHNLTLNILGYIPGISSVSGCVRIGTGVAMCAFTLAVGDPKARQGVIIGHWYNEALLTGITQVARGVLEAFVPFGWIMNASLDAPSTIVNLRTVFNDITRQSHPFAGVNYNPYADPEYPLALCPLYLA